MPKKETTSIRTHMCASWTPVISRLVIEANQTPAGIPNHMKSSLRNVASAVHHTSKSDERVEAEEDEWDAEDGGDDK